MARRPTRCLALVTSLALILGACSGEAGSVASSENTASSTTVAETSTTTSTTTSTIRTTSTAPSIGETEPLPGAEIGIPEDEGKFPSVVLVHGGGWVVGSPVGMEALAIYLTDNGYLTVNASYHLSQQSPGFPAAIDDIACAVRFAASHPRSNGTVVVIGHSAGAHIGSLVALTGEKYGEDCPYPGTGVPERFIGLAGPYDIARLGPIMLTFFGSSPEDSPEDWQAGNPQLQVGENPALRTLLIHGAIDQVVPADFSENFYDALVETDADTEILVLDGVDHSEVRDPSIVGETVLDWLSR
ncbi:MAG TPA: alpha/beta hydrolase [Acidimicrobiia bacterium]